MAPRYRDAAAHRPLRASAPPRGACGARRTEVLGRSRSRNAEPCSYLFVRCYASGTAVSRRSQGWYKVARMAMTAPSETLEPVLEPELPIVDPHHHLWDRRPVLDSIPTTGWGQLTRRWPRYLLDELMADL